ncbi:MAG TPA: TonB-dependent receptor, partial [Bacteroidia bacterium]
GLTARMDDGQLDLRHQRQRIILDTVVIGKRFEQNVCAYLDETYKMSEKFFINSGLRADFFYFNYRSELANQPHYNDSLSGSTSKARLSPKLNLFYNISENVQLFARSGYGFHSNDARAVVSNPNQHTLPAALGYEVGSIFKLTPTILINAALWGLNLQQELTYGGDDGTVVINGPTRRLGADFSVRYQIAKILYGDFDINYSYGRFVDLPEGKNFIPLAPLLTSIAGLSMKLNNGFNASLRYRYMMNRPANEDNTVIALGYFLVDAVLSYKVKHFEFGLRIDNVFNADWNEAQFDTLTRLKNEAPTGMDQLCFTPGAPRIIRLSLSYFFNDRHSE